MRLSNSKIEVEFIGLLFYWSAMRIEKLNWAPSVKNGLGRILRAGADADNAVVFDFDNTLIIRNMGDPVSEILTRRGYCQSVAIPAGLSRNPISINSVGRLSAEQDLNDLYEDHLRTALGRKDADSCIADAYAWAVWSLAGVSPARIVEVVREVYDGGSAVRDCESKAAASVVPNTVYLRPFVHPDMLDLLADLIDLRFKINIVSSSMPWTVRWVTQNVINPALLARGAKGQIEAKNVYGIAPQLIDGGKSTNDRTLVEADEDYANLRLERLEELRCGDRLSYPIACFEGKAEIVRENISERPYLVVGDSRNDAAMFALGMHKLWFKITEKQETIIPAMIMSSPAGEKAWLVQAVNSVLQPGFRPEEVLLRRRDQNAVSQNVFSLA